MAPRPFTCDGGRPTGRGPVRGARQARQPMPHRRRSIPHGDRDRWVCAAKGGRGLIGGVVLVLERAWNGC
ncbi:hypothetical protein GQ55_9G557200 [Panicum hallii var. hallii]|uniref:Uncharacterized protein n=1 Tax=Panicum hallii var. hallii TaxID=1504633 RepID=A0A2T7CFG5_9POAL|nr:hypothetical protein GQ55_9G557200 [Panicum hallii var. hallii]